MNNQKFILVTVVIALIVGFFMFDFSYYLSLEFLKSQRAAIDAYYRTDPMGTTILFFLTYVAVTGLSLPGAALMSLAAGSIFGLLLGTAIVSFASATGATIAFLTSRFILRDMVQERFGGRLKIVNTGIEKDGAFYLFALRLVPLFPFFVINPIMGLTSIRTVTFYFVSQVGMLAGTLVFVNAGTQLAQLEFIGDILSPSFIASFTLLGTFPLIARKFLEFVKTCKILGKYSATSCERRSEPGRNTRSLHTNEKNPR